MENFGLSRILEICKLFDQAEMGNHKNISIKYLNSKLKDKNLLSTELEEVTKGLEEYASVFRDVRDKSIVHNDRDVLIANNDFSGRGREETRAFFDNLQKYDDLVCNILSLSFTQEITPFNPTSSGGARMLIYKLQKWRSTGVSVP